MAELRWGASTDAGRVRTQNEDNMSAAATLFVVADGMGGHQAGEIASQLTVERLESALATDSPSLNDLVDAIHTANRAIYDASLANSEQQGMGTTVTALAVTSDPDDGEVFALANVGDSRTYLFRNGRLRQLTIDHSYVQELVAEGHISRDEARNHPRRNIVTRALGIEDSIRVDSWAVPIVRGDRFVLCSDGLVDEVHDDDITAALAAAHDPQEAADALVHLANESGGRDNITVVVVDVLEGDAPPDPTEEIDVVPMWAPTDADAPMQHDESGVPVGGIVADPPDAPELLVTPDAADDGTPTPPPPPISGELLTEPPVDAPVMATVAASPDADSDVPRRRRGSRFIRFALVVGLAAILVLGFTVFAAWARSGYFVSFDEDDRVVIYRGREGGVLWFDATVEATTSRTRDSLDERSVSLVEATPRFETSARAQTFALERLSETTTTTSTTTTTTTTPPPDTTTDSGTGTSGNTGTGSQTGTTTEP